MKFYLDCQNPIVILLQTYNVSSAMPKILFPACLRVKRMTTAAPIKTTLTSECSPAACLPAAQMCVLDTQKITLMFPECRFPNPWGEYLSSL